MFFAEHAHEAGVAPLAGTIGATLRIGEVNGVELALQRAVAFGIEI